MLNTNIKHYAKVRRTASERVVQNNLAYTPAQMQQMVEHGVPVTTHNLNPDLFFDGVPINQGTFDLPLDRLRGVDVADCWQADCSVKKKAKKGLKNDIKLFGLTPNKE